VLGVSIHKRCKSVLRYESTAKKDTFSSGLNYIF
jgi:hypothetical protein